MKVSPFILTDHLDDLEVIQNYLAMELADTEFQRLDSALADSMTGLKQCRSQYSLSKSGQEALTMLQSLSSEQFKGILQVFSIVNLNLVSTKIIE